MADVKLGPWPAGMNNVASDYALPTSKYGRVVALRNAVNVDVDDSGKISRRKGFTPAAAMAGAHSLWRDATGGDAYVFEGETLKQFNGAAAAAVGVVPGVKSPVSYVKARDKVYFTSLGASGRVSGGALSTWGVELPGTPPSLAPTAGVFDAGTYTAAVTYVTADGRESGASSMSTVTLTAAGGISVIGMPVPVSAEVTKKRLYLSTANGEVLYRALELAPSALFASASTPITGHELRTEHLSPPPLGSALALYNDRIFIADGPTVWFTEASDFDHVDKRKNYYRFDAGVTVIAAVADGLYVCADRTYFISGAGSSGASQRVVLDFGAISNTAQTIPKTANTIWMSPNGAVVGKAGGGVEILADGALVPGRMAGAASLVREEDGLRQFVTVGTTTEASRLAASSYAEAEIVRRAG